MKNSVPDAVDDLRERAEMTLRRGPAPSWEEVEPSRLLHELQIHHVELSMQNDELRLAQLELEESQAAYQALFDEAPVGYFISTPAGIIVRANACLAELLGSRVQELVGTTFPRFAAPSDLDTFHLHAMDLRAKGAASCEMALVTTSGEQRLVRLQSYATRDPAGDVTLMRVCVIDATPSSGVDDSRTEESVRPGSADDLESLGRLAGGIAHHLNGRLTAILGNLSLARVHPEEADVLLDDAERSALQAASLANRLLTFAEGGAPVSGAVELGELVAEAVRSTSRGSRVKLELELDENLADVDGDADQLRQVIESLVANAIEATDDRGVVRVAAKNIVVRERDTPRLPGGLLVCVEVADEGGGILPSDRLRIFEPYFTTKPERSGLGLTIALSVARQHGGVLDVSSRLGEGTTTRLYLPAALPLPLASSRQPLARAPREQPGEARVLVMDDEASLRRVCLRVLQGAGYEAEAVADGEAAVAAYRASLTAGRPYDIVVLDLMIPHGMGGLETLKRLRELDPAVRAVVSSGYSSDPVMSAPASYGFSGVVKKPYLPKQLTDAIEHILERSRPASKSC